LATLPRQPCAALVTGAAEIVVPQQQVVTLCQLVRASVLAVARQEKARLRLQDVDIDLLPKVALYLLEFVVVVVQVRYRAIQ
jgi:hypothetical protein